MFYFKWNTIYPFTTLYRKNYSMIYNKKIAPKRLILSLLALYRYFSFRLQQQMHRNRKKDDFALACHYLSFISIPHTGKRSPSFSYNNCSYIQNTQSSYFVKHILKTHFSSCFISAAKFDLLLQHIYNFLNANCHIGKLHQKIWKYISGLCLPYHGKKEAAVNGYQ